MQTTQRASLVPLTLGIAVLFSLIYTSTVPAQNYYPSDIGNRWVLLSEDGAEQRTYTVEAGEETADGTPTLHLRIVTAALGTTTSTQNLYRLEVSENGLFLHHLSVDLGAAFGTVATPFSPPQVFFPLPLELGVTWETAGEGEVQVVGAVRIETESEVVAIEDVETPLGTFEGCAKIALRARTITALGIQRGVSYQWLAPDIGPVKYEDPQNIVFTVVASNLLASPDVNGDGVVNILDLTYTALRFGQDDLTADANGDGAVNILDLTLIALSFSN